MNSNWKYTEKLVELIEKSISPDSIVLHNQFLPVLNSKIKRTRQCDTIIISGSKARKTLTIVEVQDRDSQVDINTFGGWLIKLEEVGAQHLICVSRQKFPESIKEKAESLGGKVRLVQLRELDTEKIPLPLFNVKIIYENFEILDIENLNCTLSKSDIIKYNLKEEDITSGLITANDLSLSYDKVNLINLHRITEDSIEKLNLKGVNNSLIKLEDPTEIYLKHREFFIQLKLLEFNCKWSLITYNIPINILSYEQEGDGELAWVAEGKFNNDQTNFWVRIPILIENDELLISHAFLEANRNIKFSITMI